MDKAIKILESIDCKTTMNYNEDEALDHSLYYKEEDVLKAINKALTLNDVVRSASFTKQPICCGKKMYCYGSTISLKVSNGNVLLYVCKKCGKEIEDIAS